MDSAENPVASPRVRTSKKISFVDDPTDSSAHSPRIDTRTDAQGQEQHLDAPLHKESRIKALRVTNYRRSLQRIEPVLYDDLQAPVKPAPVKTPKLALDQK
jgi:hypothetical protein